MAAEQIQAALTGIWERSYPLVLKRVSMVEAATAELSKASPATQTVTVGRDEAHKLAGVLGTFGLDRGTRLARDLELHLNAACSQRDAATAEDLAAELRSVIESARPHTGQRPTAGAGYSRTPSGPAVQR